PDNLLGHDGLLHSCRRGASPRRLWKVVRSGRRAALASHRRDHEALATCANSSSTGVARPKIDTDTLRRLDPCTPYTTMPEKPSNGPSVTLTGSPVWKVMIERGRSCPSTTWLRIRATSSSRIGSGRPLGPRKPVTRLIALIR